MVNISDMSERDREILEILNKTYQGVLNGEIELLSFEEYLEIREQNREAILKDVKSLQDGKSQIDAKGRKRNET